MIIMPSWTHHLKKDSLLGVVELSAIFGMEKKNFIRNFSSKYKIERVSQFEIIRNNKRHPAKWRVGDIRILIEDLNAKELLE